MRLFVAINFPAQFLASLEAYQKSIQNLTLQGRFVPQDNLHLTLQFLGEVNREVVSQLCESLNMVQAAEFMIKANRLGWFGSVSPYRVLWLGLQGEVELLQKLQLETGKALSQAGVTYDHKPFRPHITLARNVEFQGREKAEQAQKLNVPQEEIFVAGFSLMLSRQEGGRRIYEELAYVSLGKS